MAEPPHCTKASSEPGSLGPAANVWAPAQQVLEILSTLSYRSNALDRYLERIACGVSVLLDLDWSVVTFCQADQEKVMASSLPLTDGLNAYSLHGTLTETVVKTGKTLAVDNALAHPEFGQAPPGYTSYLGIPLVISTGEVIGTICSFCIAPRDYTAEEVRTVELFADRAATAIENFRMFQQLQHLNAHLEVEVMQRTEELRLAQSRLIDQERLAAIGEFAATIVHEIRNPVTTILMALQAVQPHLQDERNRRRITLALEEVDRLQKLVQEILLYSKPQILHLMTLEIHQFLAEMFERLPDEIPAAKERKLVLIPGSELPDVEPLYIVGDRDKLKQVMINLVCNACEAIAPGEPVTCQVATTTPGEITLSLQNGGEPIPPEILPLLSQPFYSSKASGTGLGLAVVQRIMKAHGGKFAIDSSPASGTTVTLIFPSASAPVQ